jgi:predicted nucleotidyltransferase
VAQGDLEMSEITKKVIQEIRERIVDHFQPEKIILFGSYSYGKPSIDSDIDLLIIKEDVESKRKEAVGIRKILRGLKMPFDIIVTTPKEFEFYSKEWLNSVFVEAREKGIVIYERT